jgi:hypothetical protein
MKKMFLTLALVATVLVSCNKIQSTEETTVDSTTVAIDSVQVDSTMVSDAEARDYLNDTVK